MTYLDWVARVTTGIASVIVILMMLHVSADVFARTLFHKPLIGTTEIVSAYYMVAIAFLPIAWISRQRGHIIVELFTAHLPRRKLKRLDAFAGLVTLGYVGLFVWKLLETAIEKTHIREAWEAATGFVEVWPSRWIVPAGFAFMAIYVLIQTLGDLRAARSSDDPPNDGPSPEPAQSEISS
ncbi:TRAP-type C4-dicarboxylate transport system, small permease component [Celeribacter baekdonensis]|uniref:TRAP transporter small permease protein n=1 Tax=Celeribacter baekdonensis TaxID=875171 RepID=A0A1G7P576_9RHOB|nr:TRAP transporter small permease [Celeribacter baekdonensis]SDF81394.1 TRAP-type C4-dicarboxylate transport system, small permease component [Celeribacter baekdonensis]